MNTFLPYDDFVKCAQSLDTNRLNSQYNEIVVVLRSLSRVYDIKPSTGYSGFENHTVAKFWKGHELALAKLLYAITDEYVKRPLGAKNPAEALTSRKKRRQQARDLVEYLEDHDWPEDNPSLVGEEEFHSAFRAFLLYKDIQNVTFTQWKRGKYPDHAVTRQLLPRKASWKRETYEAIWEYFGRPEPRWYGSFGWTEEPNDLLVYYTHDRVGQIKKEIQRKIDKPTSAGLARARAPNEI